MASTPKYIDGLFASPADITAAPSVTRPFKDNTTPDVHARTVKRKFLAAPSRFAPRISSRTSYTNYLPYSEDYSNVLWTHAALTLTAAARENPWDGQLTFSKLLETAANVEHRNEQNFTFTAVPHTVSVYLAAGLGRDFVRVMIYDTVTFHQNFFNITVGSVVSLASGNTATVKLYEDGSVRISITLTTAAGAGAVYVQTSTNGSTVSFAGDTAKGFYLGGVQIERAASAGPYISTTTAARTISAPDVDSIANPAGVDADDFAFLTGEDDLEPDDEQAALLARSYSRIPKDQVTYPGSRYIQFPAVPGTSVAIGAANEYRLFGTDYLFYRDNKELDLWKAYSRKVVTSDTGAPSYYPTGGTYTITFAGNTTGALNYNDAAATVQAALNALTSVSNRGGCTVTGSYNSAGGLVITFAAYGQITIASGSLTGTGTLTNIQTLVNSGYSQSVGAYYVSPYYVPTADKSGLTSTSGLFVNVDANFPQARTSYLQIYGGNITGGTYTITLNGATTSAIAHNATAVTIQAAINALGVGTYTVTGGLTPTVDWVQIYITTQNDSATGGTYTITVGANTTGALNYNDAAATVQAALNALTSVSNRGGCTVTGALASGWGIAFSNPVCTASAGSLTPSGSGASPSITDGGIGRLQKIVFSASTSTRTLYIANHGIAAADIIFLNSGTTFAFGIVGSAFTVIDANNIRLNVSPADSWAAFGTIGYVGKFQRNYEPATRQVRVQQTQKFYLPGVTPGITTGADITPPSDLQNASDLLTAVLALTGFQTYQSEGPSPWKGSILTTKLIGINLDDVSS